MADNSETLGQLSADLKASRQGAAKAPVAKAAKAPVAPKTEAAPAK